MPTAEKAVVHKDTIRYCSVVDCSTESTAKIPLLAVHSREIVGLVQQMCLAETVPNHYRLCCTDHVLKGRMAISAYAAPSIIANAGRPVVISAAADMRRMSAAPVTVSMEPKNQLSRPTDADLSTGLAGSPKDANTLGCSL